MSLADTIPAQVQSLQQELDSRLEELCTARSDLPRMQAELGRFNQQQMNQLIEIFNCGAQQRNARLQQVIHRHSLIMSKTYAVKLLEERIQQLTREITSVILHINELIAKYTKSANVFFEAAKM
jgi:hypothetical protein